LPPVQAYFTDNINEQQTATFTDGANHESAVLWSFGNGDTSTALNPVETFAAGNYTVTLVAYNAQCAASDSFSRIVVIDSCPVANFTYQLEGLNAFFYGDTTDAVLYNWNFGDGSTISATTPHVLHLYAHAGTYTVTLNEVSPQGCKRGDTVALQLFGTGLNDQPVSGVLVLCNLFSTCQLKFTNPGLWNLEVYDIQGRQLLTQQITGDYLLQTSALQAGVYLLRVYNDSESLVKRFVRE
jgi:hypothetical protein